MFNLILFLIFLICVGIVAAWVAENPGTVTIYWFDWRIDTSFAFIMLGVLLAALAVVVTVLAVRRLLLAPSRFRERRSLRLYERGLSELTYSVAALAAADMEGAEKHTRKAEKLLGQTPLTLLLSAQISRTKQDDDKTRRLLVQMLDHEETEYLAARSLSESASKQHLLPKALELAKRAHKINPQGVETVVSLHIRLAQWQEALHAVNKATRKGALTRQQIRHHRGMIYLAQGQQLMEAGLADGAHEAARKALKELPDFPPAIAFAARAYAGHGQRKAGIGLLLKAWKPNPHPLLADTLRELIRDESREVQKKWLDRLNAIHAEEPLGDAAWACSRCGQATKQWHAHCPACDAYDALEWKKRELRFAV